MSTLDNIQKLLLAKKGATITLLEEIGHSEAEQKIEILAEGVKQKIEKRRARDRARYRANPEFFRLKNKLQRDRNPERTKELARASYQRNKKYYQEYWKKYKELHGDEIRQRQREYDAAHREQKRLAASKRYYENMQNEAFREKRRIEARAYRARKKLEAQQARVTDEVG